MNKTKLIAISGMCAAVVVGCLALAAYVHWLILLVGIVAGIATTIPIMIDSSNLWISLLVYLAGSILGIFFGWANITYVMPIVAFCIPFSIVKVYGEKVKVSATVAKEDIMDDPFDDKAKVVKVQFDKKTKINPVVRWILYYVLMEAALGLTILFTHIVTPSLLEEMISNKLLYILLAAMQFAVYPYNLLLRGCIVGTEKILKKALR